MRRRMSFLGCGAIGLLLASTSPLLADDVVSGRAAHGSYVRPLTFEANVGQAGASVRYVGRAQAAWFLMAPTEVVIAIPSKVVRMRLIGANTHAVVAGLEPQPGHVSYFRGNDPAAWRTRIPTYARVRYEEVYPGIDLVFYGRDGWLEYDFIVKPGGRPESIQLAFDGVEGVRVNDRGTLVLDLDAHGRELRHHAPAIYQITLAGERVRIDGRYVVAPAQNGDAVAHGHRVRFKVARYDRTRDLVIDPVLTFSSYLGGANDDGIYAVAADAAGNAW